MKANEFLHRRLTVEDVARAHVHALGKAPALGFDVFLVSAPTPFAPSDALALKRDAPSVIARCYPDAASLHAKKGWALPARIGRVYDARHAERVLGFRRETDFGAILAALRTDAPLPFTHDAAYVSPQVR